MAYAIKSLTDCVKLIRKLNHFGHGVSYTQLEEIDTFPSLLELETRNENTAALPETTIQPYVFTTLSWDNVDRHEETLSGKGTSHRVNGIAVQADVLSPQLHEKEFELQNGTKELLQLMIHFSILTMLENDLLLHPGHRQ